MKEFAPLLVLIAPIMIVMGIITRDTCFFRHRKRKYVACEPVGTWVAENTRYLRCPCALDNHRYRARWVCEGCGKMGEHCVKGWGEWTIEHGAIVPNVKKLANWGAGK